jgi:two-component system sensor histidine kinase HydH
MSRWVRELLVSLRPVNDDDENVDLVLAVDDALSAFDP